MSRAHLTLCALVLAGCASSGSSAGTAPAELPPALMRGPVGSEARITTDERGVPGKLTKPADEVFRTVAAVYQELDLDPDLLDPRGRVIGSTKVVRGTIAGTRSEDLVRCGNEGAGPSAASRLRITFDIRTQVVPSGTGASDVRTTVRASGVPVGGTGTGQIVCVSLGDIERTIIGRTALRLGIEPG